MMVSVIVPNYNHADFLDQRILSIINQTYQDFELILLDDCSTDNSREVIEKYRTDPHVTNIIYNSRNSGSTFIQWQKGFDLSKGKYIWIAESDDYADKNFLWTLVSCLEKNPKAVLAFSGINYVDKSGIIIKRTGDEDSEIKCFSGNSFIHGGMLTGNMIANASAAVFLKKALLNISKEYMSYTTSGDRLFWIEIAKSGDVYKISQHLDYFRQHVGEVSYSAVRTGRQVEESYRIYKYLCENYNLTINEKNKIIGDSLFNIRRSKCFSSPDIKTTLYRMWERETGCPVLLIMQTVFRRTLRHIINKRY